MQARSEEGHINKGNIRKKSKDRVQQPKKNIPFKEIGKGQGGRRRKKQETV